MPPTTTGRFLAQTRLRIRGEVVQPGTVLTLGQLHDRNYGEMLRRGEITMLPADAEEAQDVFEDEDEDIEDEDEDLIGDVDEEYDIGGRTVDQVLEDVAEGVLSADEALELELSRGKPRSTLVDALEELEEGEEE